MSELLKFTAIFASATMVSRFLGLFRDILFAYYFGRSGEYDAYIIAILLPFFLRRIFAEGAFSTVFVPLYTRKKNKDADIFASTAINFLLIITFSLYVIVYFFSPIFVKILGSGLSNDYFELSSNLMKITFPFITFISIWSIFSGILYNENNFFVSAVSPAITNIFTILGIIFSYVFSIKIYGPTIGFLMGGFFQMIFLFVYVKKKGHFHYYFSLKKEYVNEIMKLFIPAFFGVAISHINSIVDTNVATWAGEGGVATIQYALRLYQLPLAIFSVSIANVILPRLSKLSFNNQKEKFIQEFKDAILISLFLTIPASSGLVVLSREIIKLIYQRGNFTKEDTLITSFTLVMYSIGIIFYSIHGILVRNFYSKLNTKKPTRISFVMVLINIVLDIGLVRYMGVAGIGLATSISGLVGMLILGWDFFSQFNKKDYVDIIKIVLSTFIMSVILYFSKNMYASNLYTIFLILIGSSIYLLSSYFFGIKYLKNIIHFINKNKL
ncbi:putative peptidoglycan lipid II flippase [Marinitoga hydrogenitolerans DSM 16785]|uniref:Probable lipid II flippase MurJ n=1 Tax=Marinitoga hydrogenitolerans (strain DSM 16785 / JCM 12826 / AT1271) TaxID=1122195 RepID=A0A1M4U9M5_MARH1|nr:murein biosynthesis integral membrane protein MurJ [Marinitoga hydrogenitolerans]SHE53384.1 putative peptidoglycan lipid II flippase [Marinitoga hydrogenitolerans DSM 16785]